ncbi:hypothetical protein [Streptomyces prasinus]
MRKTITALACIAALGGGVLAGSGPASANSCGYQAKTTMHFRSGPGTGYTSWGLLREGDRLGRPQEKRNGWWKTFTMDRTASGIKSGKTGWVKGSYLRKSVCMQLD